MKTVVVLVLLVALAGAAERRSKSRQTKREEYESEGGYGLKINAYNGDQQNYFVKNQNQDVLYNNRGNGESGLGAVPYSQVYQHHDGSPYQEEGQYQNQHEAPYRPEVQYQLEMPYHHQQMPYHQPETYYEHQQTSPYHQTHHEVKTYKSQEIIPNFVENEGTFSLDRPIQPTQPEFTYNFENNFPTNQIFPIDFKIPNLPPVPANIPQEPQPAKPVPPKQPAKTTPPPPPPPPPPATTTKDPNPFQIPARFKFPFPFKKSFVIPIPARTDQQAAPPAPKAPPAPPAPAAPPAPPAPPSHPLSNFVQLFQSTLPPPGIPVQTQKNVQLVDPFARNYYLFESPYHALETQPPPTQPTTKATTTTPKPPPPPPPAPVPPFPFLAFLKKFF